jgi:hypothetical protein
MSAPTDLVTRVRSHPTSRGLETTCAKAAPALREEPGAMVGALRVIRREVRRPAPVGPLFRTASSASALAVPYGVC